jgi:hypothetical protein
VGNREINGRGNRSRTNTTRNTPALWCRCNNYIEKLDKHTVMSCKETARRQERDEKIILKWNIGEKFVAVHWNSDAEHGLKPLQSMVRAY